MNCISFHFSDSTLLPSRYAFANKHVACTCGSPPPSCRHKPPRIPHTSNIARRRQPATMASKAAATRPRLGRTQGRRRPQPPPSRINTAKRRCRSSKPTTRTARTRTEHTTRIHPLRSQFVRPRLRGPYTSRPQWRPASGPPCPCDLGKQQSCHPATDRDDEHHRRF